MHHRIIPTLLLSLLSLSIIGCTSSAPTLRAQDMAIANKIITQRIDKEHQSVGITVHKLGKKALLLQTTDCCLAPKPNLLHLIRFFRSVQFPKSSPI